MPACERAHLFDFAAGMLSQGKVLRIKAYGWSMYPFIKHGDFIEVEPVEASAVRVGDIVLCRYGADRFVAHRAVKVGRKDPQGAVIIKGDWSAGTDPPIHPQQVLGRVVAIEREKRRIRLDNGRQRLVQLLLARISAHCRWLYLPVRTYLRVAHKMQKKV